MSDARCDEVNVAADYRVKSPHCGSRRRIFATIGNPSYVVFHDDPFHVCRVCVCARVFVYEYRSRIHTSREFLFSSPSDDGKAVQGDLWKVAGVNYKVNRDHTIKEFKFVMDIDCWKLLQPSLTSLLPVYYFSFFPFFLFRLIYRRYDPTVGCQKFFQGNIDKEYFESQYK